MRKMFAGTPSGIIALVGLAVYYGLTAVLARYLGTGSSLFEQWYLRFGIALVGALVVFRSTIDLKKFLHLPAKEWWVLALRVLTGGVAAVSLYTLAAQHAKIGPVAFMQAVPTMAVLGVLLMHDRLTARKAALVALSFIGVAIVAVKSPHDLLDFNVGEVYALVSGALFSLAFITRKWHTGVLNNQEITVAMIGLSFAADYVISVALYHRPFAVIAHWSLGYTAILLFSGVIAVGSIFLQNYAFERIGGVVAGSILNLEQVFGPVFGFVFYRESLSAHEFLGGAIILAAALAMSQLSRKDELLAAPVPD